MRPEKRDVRGVSERIRHFPPSWFAITMGTGVVSSLFYNFPYGSHSVLHPLADAFAILNLVLFSTFAALSIARYIMFPEIWNLMLFDPVQSLYLSCIPMGFTTLIVAGVSVVQSRRFGGETFVYVLWTAWWIDAVLSILVCFGLVHIMITRHTHTLGQMTAAWLLPVVAPIVASTTGHLVASVLTPYSPSRALMTSTVSLAMCLTGLSIVFLILPAYFLRLVAHGLPSSGLIISCFLPLGPCGQGGYSLLVAADVLEPLLKTIYGSSLLTSEVGAAAIRIVLLAGAFVLWILGTVWLVFALAAVAEVLARNKLKFALPWWGLVFPNGVYTLLTIQLGRVFGGSAFFTNFGAAWAVVTMVLWISLAIPTAGYAYEGSIFIAPCLPQPEIELPPRTPPP